MIDRNIPCSAISPSPNDAARYQRPRGTFTGVRFTVGLPFLENHSDPTAAPTPLNMTSMFWTWQYGYRFFTLDVTVTPKPDETARPHGFPVHLGSTGCESVSATEAPRKECSAPNLVTVTLPNFDPSQQTVKLDIRQILATSDVSTNQPKTAPGCMSDPDDQDCKGIFQAFGLPFGSETSPPAQSVFRGR
ncbi:metallo-mystery pair system four-Cys motif protein [Komagataeibacter oboediens]|uniref:Metallo-mystery pair system four-Cys motif protein n=1 Tax=Komagataeibacter oboediens TaxID=65958 RepID=A0A318QCZ2_9PROT|nr:MbnP family copper-binding protein [Komagataeibacter oboediens]PYD77506.1 metallo-mystery pair system four-Cys motif protein [Komagataeibacter oboediens]